MGSVRYIGSKARVVGTILELVGPPDTSNDRFVDAFCGTGVVAQTAAARGWRVRINDHLRSAVVMSRARLLATSDVPFTAVGGYEAAVRQLNAAEDVDGFFVAEYSPASSEGRMYFSECNASRIDGARSLLASWEREGRLSGPERDLLIADLIGATNQVANIAGTYGCYLTHWTDDAKRPLVIEPRNLRSTPVDHEVYCGDVVGVPIAESDVAYFDPPYTKRQYAAYYHVLETLTEGDSPVVGGKTGLRPWRERASEYCYKRKALTALSDLISNTSARRIFLSYSSEGHVDLNELKESLSGQGRVAIHPLASVGRYRPNREASAAGNQVAEFVVELERAAAGQPQVAVG